MLDGCGVHTILNYHLAAVQLLDRNTGLPAALIASQFSTMEATYTLVREYPQIIPESGSSRFGVG
jgi:hypothetical protein